MGSRQSSSIDLQWRELVMRRAWPRIQPSAMASSCFWHRPISPFPWADIGAAGRRCSHKCHAARDYVDRRSRRVCRCWPPIRHGRSFPFAGHRSRSAQRRTDGIEIGREGRQRGGGSDIFHARQQDQTAGALNEHADCGLVAGGRTWMLTISGI